jgi:hypothetical protein
MGRPRQPGGPHAEGSERAHARVETSPDGKYPFYPAPHAPLRPSLHEGGSGAASVTRADQAGAAWGFRLAVAVPGFKSEGGRQRASRPSYQPHWGFPFPLHLRGRREKEEKEAPPLRRAEEGRGHTGTPTTCQGRSAPPPRRAGRGRSRERGVGARTGAAGDVRRREHLLHRERLHRPEHHRHATDDPKLATTTPPPHREHRPATLLSSPPWSSSCVESANVETRRCYSLAWVLAIEPQNYRAATDGAPGSFVLLSAAVAVR